VKGLKKRHIYEYPVKRAYKGTYTSINIYIIKQTQITKDIKEIYGRVQWRGILTAVKKVRIP